MATTEDDLLDDAEIDEALRRLQDSADSASEVAELLSK